MATRQEALDNILRSAAELGVEMDEAEALQWLTAMAAQHGEADDVEVQVATGVYGHRVAMMDFSPTELDRFRAIGDIVGLEDRPGQVETALALSGSAAQSKIQTYPGDCDYFERVNIHAPTRDEACRILGEIMREKVLATASGPTQRFIQARLGSYPTDVIRGAETITAGSSITWTMEEVREGKIMGSRPDGSPWEQSREDAAKSPGWCKLDWVVADPVRSTLANASNMLDATWEAPTGRSPRSTTTSTATSRRSTSTPTRCRSSPSWLAMCSRTPWTTMRSSSSARSTSTQAAYLRELFDEKATALYQVAALIRSHWRESGNR